MRYRNPILTSAATVLLVGLLLAAAAVLLAAGCSSSSEAPAPPTPQASVVAPQGLTPAQSGFADVNGARLWGGKMSSVSFLTYAATHSYS
jgi:hypothetical protein